VGRVDHRTARSQARSAGRRVRNKATLIPEALLQGEAAELTRAAIERAKAGNVEALRMCLDRLAPPSRHRTIEYQLPQLTNAQDAVSALSAHRVRGGGG
jgi:DNA-directed RNA polymerase specialized sigma24 family protein